MTSNAKRVTMSVNPNRKSGTILLPYLAPALAVLVILFSIFVLIGWTTNLPGVARLNARFIPMAPATALCFALLGAAMLTRHWRPNHRTLRRVWQVLAGVVLLFNTAILFQFALVSATGLSLDLEQWFVTASWSEQGYVVGRISPLAAFLFMLLSFNALFSIPVRDTNHRRDRMTQSAAASVFILAGILLVGYLYGAPLLYGGTITPVALTTSLGFLLLACGLLFESPNAWLSQWVTSSSVFSRFTRRVLPGTVGIILLFGWLHVAVFEQLPPIYHALSFALSALFSAGFVALLTFVTARQEQTMLTHTEQALWESETKYKAVFENVPIGISLLDREHKMIDVNAALERITRVTKDGLLAGAYRDRKYLRPDGTELPSDELASTRAIHENRPVQNVETGIVTEDGQTIWTLVSATPVDLPSSKFVVITQDITERKRVEEELLESEAKFRNLFEHSPLGESITGIDGSLHVNKAFCEILGYSEDELMTKKWMDITYPDEIQQTNEVNQALLNGSIEHARFEKRYIHKNGKIVWADVSSYLQRDKKGEPQYFITTVNDITERKRAEDELHQSQENFARAFISSPTALAITRRSDGKFLSLNEAYTRVMGYEPAEILGRTPAEMRIYAHPDERAQLIQQLREQGKVRDYELLVNTKSGEVRNLLVSMEPILYDQEACIISTFIDITERKQAEEKLTASEARYHRLFEAARDGILILDADTGQVVDVNPFLVEMLGFSREDILGKELWELGFFKDIASNKANFLELQQKEYIRYEDLPMERMDGRKFFVEFVSNVYQVDHHKVVQCNIRDITERKHAQDALRDSEKRYHSLFENMLNGFAYCRMIFDQERPQDFIYLEINRAFETLTGLKDVLGKKVSEVIPGIRESDPGLFEIYGRVALTGLPESFEIYLEALEMWFFISVYSPQKEYFVAVFDVITERKQAEQELKAYSEGLEARVVERTRELREAQEKLVRQERLAMLGQLAGSVSHELRNPLGVISNAVYYLDIADPDANPKVKEYLGIIEKETRTADKIITDLLNFSRIKSADLESVSVAELVQGVLERYPVPKSVSVTLEIPKDLPPAYADPGQMTQVLGNLVVNACQAMPKGGQLAVSSRQLSVASDQLPLNTDPLMTDTSTLRQAQDNASLSTSHWVLITIKDTGEGIPPENMDKLFEPLFSTKAKGIGLGLAICKNLVEANGGRIEVQSELGKGSTFTVYLPINKAAPVSARGKETI